MMNPWIVYRPFESKLKEQFGRIEAQKIIDEAHKIYQNMTAENSSLLKHKGKMTLPAVCLIQAMEKEGIDGVGLLNQYGDETGKIFAKGVKGITSLPFVSRIIWNSITSITDTMSAPSKGYARKLVNEMPETYGVDIISCPFHELAKEAGEERAVEWICHMDKQYMQGFKDIDYRRSQSRGMGDACCDYRLSYEGRPFRNPVKSFFGNTRKPEGLSGKMMAASMNSGHAKLGDWGMELLESLDILNGLDIGCGGGRNVNELLKRWPQAHVTGIDYSEVSVETSTKFNAEEIRAGRCTIMHGDVSQLPFDSETFDFASAFETIYFWPGLTHCFKEVFDVLKEDGKFLIVNESDGTDKASKTFEKIIEGMHAYTAEEIETALKDAGFEIQISDHHPSKPWIRILAHKPKKG